MLLEGFLFFVCDLERPASHRLQECFVWQFWFILEDIAKATEMLVMHAAFIRRERILTADLPEEWGKLVLQTVFLHVPQHFDLTRIILEVRPNIMMEWYDNITI